jgi:hypothetical protein
VVAAGVVGGATVCAVVVLRVCVETVWAGVVFFGGAVVVTGSGGGGGGAGAVVIAVVVVSVVVVSVDVVSVVAPGAAAGARVPAVKPTAAIRMPRQP